MGGAMGGGGGGGGRQQLATKAARKRPVPRRAPHRHFDFLAAAAAVGTAARDGGVQPAPSTELRVRLVDTSLEQLRAYTHLRVVVADGSGTTRALNLPLATLLPPLPPLPLPPTTDAGDGDGSSPVRQQYRSLALATPLPVDRHFSEVNTTTVVAPARPLALAGAARWGAIKTVDELLTLYAELGAAPFASTFCRGSGVAGAGGRPAALLAGPFSALRRWTALKGGAKRALLTGDAAEGALSCTEVFVWCYFRDRTTFDAAVAPLLATRAQRSFVCAWLCGDALAVRAVAASDAAFARLNAFEKALLCQPRRWAGDAPGAPERPALAPEEAARVAQHLASEARAREARDHKRFAELQSAVFEAVLRAASADESGGGGAAATPATGAAGALLTITVTGFAPAFAVADKDGPNQASNQVNFYTYIVT